MRALSIGLMVLGLMGIALVGVTSPASPVNKVVIGVLDFEASHGAIGARGEKKKVLMKELRRNTRVKLVDIRESCSLSDLKRNGYEKAERYKDSHQLDMILHVYLTLEPFAHDWRSDLSLIDLYTKKVKEVSIETRGIPIELGFRGISKKLLASGDLNRVLKEKKEVLAKKEVTVSAGAKEIPKRKTKQIPPPVTSINKVVIGVLDFEASGGRDPFERKKALMKDLGRNTRVKLVDIRESCSFSDLKRNGYEQAERYKMNYQLDMILHILQIHWSYSFSLIDLYTKKIKEVSIESAWNAPIEFMFKGISQKLLVSKDLSRVLREKKRVLAKKEVTVPKEVVERPKEIEDLIQKGPTLIAEGEYNRVLELIEDLPGRRRRHIHIQTLGCFANLKGWVSDRDQSCKLSWWNLRQKLINSGDNEATPMLVIFLKDEDPYLRLYAAELLVHIGDERALKDLREAGENDENRKVRKYAKRAYEQISGEKF